MKQPTDNREVLSDADIIELYWGRDERAIQETDFKYGKYLYAIAYNIVHDRLDCEECLNDTYLGTWNRIPPTRPNAFQVFLSRIMRNIAVDRYRREQAGKRIPSEMVTALSELAESVATSPSAETEYDMSELARIMNEYVSSLTEREQFEFVCRYYYSDALDSIAGALGISRRTVLRDLSHIRDGLRKRLDKEGIRI